MKISFHYTPLSEAHARNHDEVFTSHLEIPDVLMGEHDLRERLLSIGTRLIAPLTKLNVFMDCPTLGVKSHWLKPPADVDPHYRFERRSIFLVFESLGGSRVLKRQFRILFPVSNFDASEYGVDRRKRRKASLQRNLKLWASSVQGQLILELGEQIVSLLNADTSQGTWTLNGYHPSWQDAAVAKRLDNLSKKRVKAEREAERLARKRLKSAEELQQAAQQTVEMTHGAGRKVGARPGTFKGVFMRSQLEIRFASECEERGIRWVYESKSLGESAYLVDFYLPEHRAWVEVKGRFSAHDRQLLPGVARSLRDDQQERLFIYTQGKCYKVDPGGMKEIDQQAFWRELLRTEK